MEYIRFPSANGRDTVTGYLFPPPEEPVAVLQLVHGMAEHLGRYAHFAAFLSVHGVLVCGADHVGHGKSAAGPEDYGYWGKNGPETMVADLTAFKGRMEAAHPHIPYFLLGHSMGSFVLRSYMAGPCDNPPAGLVLSGTGTSPPGAGVGAALGRMIWALRGDRHRSRLLDRLAFGTYNSRFKDEPTGTGWEWLTRELHHVEQYRDDPACGYVFTVSALTEMISMLGKISGPEWYAAVVKDIPVLMVSGDMDPVGAYGKGVRRVERGLRAAGVADLTLKLYPGARHEVLNEANRDEVYTDILDFILSRMG